MGGVMQWLRINVLSKLHSWGRGFALGVQGICEKVAQGVGWIATFVVGAGALFFAWLAYSAYSGLEESPENKANWALEFLKFYAYVVGGIILIWQVRIANRRATALEKTAALGEKGNITERFKNAIEHLANESESVQIGGIYTLYHVAREAEEYKDAVLKIILAHLRKITAGKEEPVNEVVKAILDVLFVPINQEPLFKEVNLSGVNLRGIKWNSALGRISRCLNTIVLAVDLDLRGAEFGEVDLSHARLTGAILHKAQFRFAILYKCVLSYANCDEAVFTHAICIETDFQGVDNIQGAIFVGATLTAANFCNSTIDARQLLGAQTLYLAELPDHVRDAIMERRPELLDKPK